METNILFEVFGYNRGALLKSLKVNICSFKLYLFIILGFYLFLLLGCKERENNIKDFVVIDLDQSKTNIESQDLFVIENCVPLEISNECTIGSINKILNDSGLLIILDLTKSKATFCFDLDGNFIKKISSIGKANGEYLLNRDFIQKSDKNGYYLFDKKLNKLLEFDEELTFINEYKVPFQMNSIIELNDGNFLIERSANNKFFLSLCNKNFKINDEFLERPEYQLNYDINNPFPFKKNISGIVNYNPSLSNKIYEYDAGIFTVKYTINDKIGFPGKDFFESNKGVHPGRIIRRFQEDNYLSFLDFYENEEILLLKYFRGQKQYITLFNKKTNIANSFSTSENNLSSVLFNNVSAVGLEGSFISYIFPNELSEIDDIEKIPEKLKVLNKKIDAQGNPIIIFFKFIKI